MMLGLLPVAVCVLLAYALRPVRIVVAPLRLALLRAAVLVGAGATVLVEVLSTAHALTRPVMVAVWAAATVLAAAAAGYRYRRDGRLPDPVRAARLRWAATGRPERALVLVLSLLALAELLIAIIAPPNNYDSQTYHLPKIEHWVLRHDVSFYPTDIHRQLDIAPGAEYLLLHLRLLTGGDGAYNLLQFCAGIGCALLASRIAAQLGGSARAQLLAAFVLATTPIVALESTSTQVDLVLAAWVAGIATLVLDEPRGRDEARQQNDEPRQQNGGPRQQNRGPRRHSPLSTVALLGAATGLATLTKSTGLLAAGPLLLVWLAAQVRVDARRVAAAGPAVLLLAAIIAGPYLYRVEATYGNVFGPAYLRDSITMQRHDPAAVLVNALRIGQSALDTPVGPLNDAAVRGVNAVARVVRVGPNDPRITFWEASFPAVTWFPDEDKASFPVEALLVLGAGVVMLIRPRVPAAHRLAVRGYTAACALALLLYVATVKWQPWGNRLILFLLVLGAPLAGLLLDAVLQARPVAARPAERRTQPEARRTRLAAWAVVVALATCGCAGWLAVGYGWPRRLVGHDSIFTESRMQARFQWRPALRADYVWAAAAVRASRARRVGLVQGNDSWEYPWWVLLPGDQLVALQSWVPGRPPPRVSTVGAVLCSTGAVICRHYVPAGWLVRTRDGIGYALPPAPVNRSR